MEDIKTLKKTLRLEALARRDAMPEAERIEGSLAVAELGSQALTITPGMIVSAFLPIRSEIDLRPLMMILADRGARLCVPAMVDGELQFRHLERGAPLEPQGFGTVAPGADAQVLDPELMLMPLAAFDRKGGRIGYGRGYYDRAIASLKSRGKAPVFVGTAFACQEIEEVPMESHDVPLPRILTERGLIEPDR